MACFLYNWPFISGFHKIRDPRVLIAKSMCSERQFITATPQEMLEAELH